jgi:pimeloyl-ACP methyl ester carboxylesterase
VGEREGSFKVRISDDVIEDLRQRLRSTRWPENETVDDWSQGVPLAYVQELTRYWAEEYDMRRLEQRLNAWPQAKTEVDGLGIHHLHVRSDKPDAKPLIMTHGWPGSVVEFLNVIEPLRRDFHLVVPSLPGYGWSDKPERAGTGVVQIAELWDGLMQRLGYQEYYAQGGDWGAAVTWALSQQQPPGLLGVHLNIVVCDPKQIRSLGDPTDDEQDSLNRYAQYNEHESGYAVEQATRPQTIGYCLADTPVGQLAWIVEKFHVWTDNNGSPEDALSRDEMLDNVMVYWVTNTGASSARLYWQSIRSAMRGFDPIPGPAAYSVFPKELFVFTERIARTRLTDLRYYNRVERGGHFAAFEQPELFVDEVRAGISAIQG